ncbi:LysR family transcriptional regulator [Comamonas sp. JC664]|uniref:helix-turn-helix domain-containing protein n=1 Tax=Comamonas sp. JC664 TaxID=2801917 RepID=UPI00362249B5
MRFDLQDLRLFVHTLESGTITQGAERCHITLASASERIRGMEAVLGAPLLHRSKRGVTATEAGAVLLAPCPPHAAADGAARRRHAGLWPGPGHAH